MDTIYWNFVPQVISVTLAMGIVYAWKWARNRKKMRVPVKEKMLRPPGESLRLTLEDLNDSVLESFFSFVVLGMATGFYLQTQFKSAHSGKINWVAPFILLILWASVSGCLAWRLWNLLQRRSDYRLGFLGERLVGEELNAVVQDGGHVFHDFPADPKWNIDHVVVTKEGVFVIETKTRRKRKNETGQKDYEVVFDGQTLSFPHASDSHGLRQAQDNARWLSLWLGKAVGEPISVTPILTLPGWWIVRKANSGIKVLNPKEIRAVVKCSGTPKLSDQVIQRIVHQLDQKCRDVEFACL